MTTSECVLDVDVNLCFNPYLGDIFYADSPLDPISYEAFKNEGIRKGVWHCSIKGLTGYSWFHRWMISLVERYPSVLRYVDGMQHLHMVRCVKFYWGRFSLGFFFWCFKKYPHLSTRTKQCRIEASFDSSRTMNGLLMFHVHS
jgi:hypothetical protein